MAKFSLKSIGKEKEFLAGVGLGFFGGEYISDNALIPQVDANYQSYIEAGVKVIAGGYLYGKSRGKLTKGVGAGLAGSGVVDLVNGIMNSSTFGGGTGDEANGRANTFLQ